MGQVVKFTTARGEMVLDSLYMAATIGYKKAADNDHVYWQLMHGRFVFGYAGAYVPSTGLFRHGC